MEKEYREIKCIGLIEKNGNLTPCDKIIRFKVSEQNYGGTMEGKCPNCGQNSECEYHFLSKRKTNQIRYLLMSQTAMLKI